MNVPDLEWSTILSAEQIEAFHNRTALIDPMFAKRDREFWNTRSVSELLVIAARSWESNDKTGYVMARSHHAKAMAEIGAV